MAPSKRKKVVLAAAPIAFFASLVACNNIIGLTDFEKGECPGARCATNEGGPDQFVPDGGPDGDATVDVKGADPTVWPKWPMPNYGEAGTGDPPRALKYNDKNGDLEDDYTKLVWRKAVLTDKAKASEANAKCAAVGDYRAPKRIELVTLLDYAHGEPFIDPKFGVGLETVWTTSQVQTVNPATGAVTVTGQYWAVNFSTGKVVATSDVPASVLCVRAR